MTNVAGSRFVILLVAANFGATSFNLLLRRPTIAINLMIPQSRSMPSAEIGDFPYVKLTARL